MEDQNVNLELTLSMNSSQDRSKTTNHAIIEMEVVGLDAGLDTVAKSRPEGSNSAMVKRGRGRPQNSDVDGNPLSPTNLPPRISNQPSGSEEKRGRGRPRGSGKLQTLAPIGGCIAETDRGNMTPYVLIVNPREDVVRKIFAFLETVRQEDVCILSASGTVSSLTLCQPDVSNGFSRHEGHFDILSLSGPCTFTGGAAGGSQRTIGMLSVSLAQPDGKVFGGRVGNLLIAATPIKIFLAACKKNISKRKYASTSSTAPNMVTNQEAIRDNNLKGPKLTIEGEPSCPMHS